MHKGFTLVELLIVIAILAVLAVTVVVVLNPAELLRQARDSTRISDLAAINSAVSLWLTDVSTSTWPASGATCTSGTTQPATGACTTNAVTAVDGTGWVRNIDLSAISIGSPLARLPLDPVNNSASTACPAAVPGCFYVFKTAGTFGKYKLFANMESTKYTPVGTNAKDGGTVNDWYEVGTDMSL